ncbi:hypothetical protein GOODEAATRI_007640, partial [Goodea atripinnis]
FILLACCFRCVFWGCVDNGMCYNHTACVSARLLPQRFGTFMCAFGVSYNGELEDSLARSGRAFTSC